MDLNLNKESIIEIIREQNKEYLKTKKTKKSNKRNLK